MDFQVGRQPAWVILALWAREAFSIAAEFSHSTDIFCSKMMVFFILLHIRDGQLSNECCKQFL
jgi:hypothetical protein